MRTNKKYQRQASLLRRIPGYYKIPFFLFFLAIFSVSSLRAQELFTTGLYTNNIFTINPSFAAESDTTRVALSIYGQGNSIQDARGYCLAMHVPLHERVYVGVNVVRENYDPDSQHGCRVDICLQAQLEQAKVPLFRPHSQSGAHNRFRI